MAAILGAILFTAAGTLAWPAGWVFLGMLFAFAWMLGIWLYRNDPDLLQERLTFFGKSDQKTWDKVFFVGINGYFLAWLALMGLDAVRFHWSTVPPELRAVGGCMIAAAFYGFFATFRENAYLSPVVRVQFERGHTVVTTGPYRWVRHPLYAAAIPFVTGTALLLGSWYGLLASLAMVLGLGWRAVGEERVLLAELAGYDAYRSQVKYRFIPYIW